jgi:hypothetical protein
MVGLGLGRIGDRVAACLAVLALVLVIAVPPGYMVDRSAGRAGIVVCTGHGPLVVGSDPSAQPGKLPKKSRSAACAFAGHPGSAPVVPVFLPTSVRLAVVAPAAVSAPDLLPGRGLAAPPPPSQAPPRLPV